MYVIPTVRNHYNPCFWTAHWNPDYFRRAAHGDPPANARTQSVYVLSVKADRMFESTVENVHFDKHLGMAQISREAAEEFSRRYYPEQHEEFVLGNAEEEYPVYIDFEQIVTAMEGMDPYRVLIDTVRRGRIAAREEKAFLAVLLVFQFFRSHAIMTSMIEFQAELKVQKFEHFVTLKWMLGNPQFLFRAVKPLMESRWTFYATTSDTFPLCDSPVLIKPENILFALSPRLLLEIDRTTPSADDQWRHRDGVPGSKLAAFRRRTIGNTFREIIFGDPEVLRQWQGAREYRERVALIQEIKSYNRLVQAETGREFWHVNAYGNR